MISISIPHTKFYEALASHEKFIYLFDKEIYIPQKRIGDNIKYIAEIHLGSTNPPILGAVLDSLSKTNTAIVIKKFTLEQNSTDFLITIYESEHKDFIVDQDAHKIYVLNDSIKFKDILDTGLINNPDREKYTIEFLPDKVNSATSDDLGQTQEKQYPNDHVSPYPWTPYLPWPIQRQDTYPLQPDWTWRPEYAPVYVNY